MLSFFGREAVSKVTTPIGAVLLRSGLTPNSVTIIGTVATMAAALTLFPMGQLFWGTMVIWLFVMFDMMDGAMARARGGGTKYGAVLDASCDRLADGAIFAGLGWWAAYGREDQVLFVATMICLVTSQAISYVKARAEASGLTADGGWIERPDRLIIVLVGAGLTGLALIFDIGWLEHAIDVAMWPLAVASIVTVFQRILAVRRSPGSRDIIPIVAPTPDSPTAGDPPSPNDKDPEGP